MIEDQAVIAGQCGLQPAAEARAVDDGDGRDTQPGELIEYVLPEGGDCFGIFGLLHGRELVQVGAGHKSGWLFAA